MKPSPGPSSKLPLSMSQAGPGMLAQSSLLASVPGGDNTRKGEQGMVREDKGTYCRRGSPVRHLHPRIQPYFVPATARRTWALKTKLSTHGALGWIDALKNDATKQNTLRDSRVACLVAGELHLFFPRNHDCWWCPNRSPLKHQLAEQPAEPRKAGFPIQKTFLLTKRVLLPR